MVCSVDGCDRPRKFNSVGQFYALCSPHRWRQQRYGDPLAGSPVGVKPSCLVPDCTDKHKAFGYCLTHYRRWKKTGDPLGLRDNTGPRKLDVGYMGAHYRVRTAKGLASAHACSCGSQAAHWAYDHNDPDERKSPEGLAFSLDANHYIPMCVSCHRTFDKNYERIG